MYGYKALAWDPGAACAISPLGLTAWRGARSRAVCLHSDFTSDDKTPHIAPDENCTCGIYALGMFLWLLDYASNSDIQYHMERCFTALLRASGKVIEHAYGWRAEAAEIIAISSAPTISRVYRRMSMEAAEALGVPFEPSPLGLASFADLNEVE